MHSRMEKVSLAIELLWILIQEQHSLDIMEQSAYQVRNCFKSFFWNSVPWIQWNSVRNSSLGTTFLGYDGTISPPSIWLFRILLSEQRSLDLKEQSTFPARNCSEFHFRNSVPWMSMEQTSNYKSAPRVTKDEPRVAQDDPWWPRMTPVLHRMTPGLPSMTQGWPLVTDWLIGWLMN